LHVQCSSFFFTELAEGSNRVNWTHIIRPSLIDPIFVAMLQENSRAAREALRSAEEARSQFEAQVSILGAS
jgi:hypothetical protein